MKNCNQKIHNAVFIEQYSINKIWGCYTMPVNKTELVSFYSHAIAALASFIGLFILIEAAQSYIVKILSAVYAISVIALFSASTLYHGLKRQDNEESKWRKLDHMAIFIMIAGTYTPVCYLYLPATKAFTILFFQWLLVASGILFKLYFFNAPRIIYTAIYLIMGWMAIVVIKDIVHIMDSTSLWYLFAGGIAFTAGAVFYIMQWPKKIQGYVGFHEFFHFFIVAGAVCHYLMVYRGVKYM